MPPLVTDINLSLDDRFLYVPCRGTGEPRQYDVSDPFKPTLTGSVRLGGIVAHAPHPTAGPLDGGPQMVEVSRDGRRVYFSNSLYGSWDAQFYPEGICGWVAKLEAPAEGHAHDLPTIAAGSASLVQGAAAVLLHTLAMLLAMGAVAVIVYERVGLGVLRRAWVNLDLPWAVAIMVTGALTLFT